MPHPQFSLKTMLWLTLVVAAFFGGMIVQERFSRRRWAAHAWQVGTELSVPIGQRGQP